MTAERGGLVLVDTCIWIDHLRNSDEELVRLLGIGCVGVHPMIIGELALGRLRHRTEVLELLQGLPDLPAATDGEVRAFVEGRDLPGRGLGWVDAHLLAAVLLTPGTRLWTRDRALAEAAAELGCS